MYLRIFKDKFCRFLSSVDMTVVINGRNKPFTCVSSKRHSVKDY